ncbi:hypothetical protein [Longispora fulva]|uniref:Uncharacterized protein n=1 Tax=Longispora fulva TaxID=619741 RepID=A0A8J7KSC5_9ACTN|nr:hypothetical protein [Longispora fulva]MBG6139467.1 hypothetical protein [Longispora fulva]
MTSIPASASDEIGDHVHAVLAAGVVGDLDGAMRSVDEIVAEHGAWAVYDLAGAIVTEMLGDFRQPEDAEFWTLDFPGIESAGYDLRWVARFISAHANGEEDTARALYRAAVNDEEIRPCLGALVTSAIATLRR